MVQSTVKLPPGTNASEKYFPALDGLRTIAILLVFVAHYGSFPQGGRGVSIFFVLSGFLITRVLLDARHEAGRFKKFYLRRSLRIFPLYFSVWLVIAALTPVLHIWWTRGNWLYLVYLGNYIWTFWNTPTGPALQYVHMAFGDRSTVSDPHFTRVIFVGHFWTLCVEEQFYLVWPMVVFWTRRVKDLLPVCVSVIGIVTVLKIAASFHEGFPSEFTRMTLLKCDEFAWGGLLAVLLHLGHEAKLLNWARILLLVTTAVLIGAYVVEGLLRASDLTVARWDFSAVTPAVDAFSVVVILCCLGRGNWIAMALSWAPMRWLGRISYGFYVFHDLCHAVIRGWVERHIGASPEAVQDAAVALIALAITLVLSVLSYRYLETPFLRMKNRFAGHAG